MTMTCVYINIPNEEVLLKPRQPPTSFSSLAIFFFSPGSENKWAVAKLKKKKKKCFLLHIFSILLCCSCCVRKIENEVNSKNKFGIFKAQK